MLFLGGCNFRCPFCHNHVLVLRPETIETLDEAAILEKLAGWKNWLGGVCVSGGEPTLDAELPDLLRRLRREGWPVKLDTNGSRPEVLDRLLAEGLLDMVSMDVKAPLAPEKYARCAGVAVDLEKIRASVALLKASDVQHEFRMTVLPAFHGEDDIVDWVTELSGSRLKLQNFRPIATLDPAFTRAAVFQPDIFNKLCRLAGA